MLGVVLEENQNILLCTIRNMRRTITSFELKWNRYPQVSPRHTFKQKSGKFSNLRC